MGVAVINSHLGKGLYTIILQFSEENMRSRLSKIVSEKVILNEGAPEVLDDQGEVISEEVLGWNQLTALIQVLTDDLSQKNVIRNAYIQASSDKYQKEIELVTTDILDIQKEIESTQNKITLNRIEFAEISREKDKLEDELNPLLPIEAWCVDYTTNLKIGDYVETVEINDEHNEPNTYINIRPLAESSKPALKKLMDDDLDNARELNQIEHPLNSKKWTVLYNWMSQPAYQKWYPRYRKGVISAINKTNQNCSVTYNNQQHYSSIEPFPVGFDFAGGATKYDIELNIVERLVPIKYMQCNSDVFEIGDDVVVYYEYNRPSSPAVIGFFKNPIRCKIQYLAYINNSDDRLFAHQISDRGVFSGDPEIDLLASDSSINTENRTHGRRLNYGVSLLPNNDNLDSNQQPEVEDYIYTFDEEKVYRNGEEITLPVNLLQYPVNLANPGELPVISDAYNYIVAIDAREGYLYLLCYSNKMPVEAQYTRSVYLSGIDITLDNYGYGHPYGMRLFIFEEPPFLNGASGDYTLSNTKDIPFGLKTKRNLDTTSSFTIFYNDWTYTSIDTSIESDAFAFNEGFSKMLGFSLESEFIVFSFITRIINLAIQTSPTHETHVMLLDRHTLNLTSHIWKRYKFSDIGIQGALFGHEKWHEDLSYPYVDGQDKMNYDPINDPDNELIDGNVIVQGNIDLEESTVLEPQSDSFIGLGNVT